MLGVRIYMRVYWEYLEKEYRIVAQVRTLLNAVIFDKLLRLKQSALIDTTTGQIINLVTNDSFKILVFHYQCSNRWHCGFGFTLSAIGRGCIYCMWNYFSHGAFTKFVFWAFCKNQKSYYGIY